MRKIYENKFLLSCTFKCYDQEQSNFITIVTIMQIKVEQHLASKYILLGTCFFLLFSCCFNIIGSQKYHPEIQKIWPITWTDWEHNWILMTESMVKLPKLDSWLQYKLRLYHCVKFCIKGHWFSERSFCWHLYQKMISKYFSTIVHIVM